ncbi:MAG: hypothetical protein WHS46_04485 [Desulfosoma sp.]
MRWRMVHLFPTPAQLLAQKQASLKQGQELADQLKKIAPSGGLHDLTMDEL